MTPLPSQPVAPITLRREGVAELKELIQEFTWKILRLQSTRSSEFGLTRPQAFALNAIAHFGPDIDMATLSSVTSLPASSITSIIDRFLELGYVERNRHEADRRRVTACITPQGSAHLQRIEAEGARMLEELLEGMDDTSIGTVSLVFRHMMQKIDHAAPPAEPRNV